MIHVLTGFHMKTWRCSKMFVLLVLVKSQSTTIIVIVIFVDDDDDSDVLARSVSKKDTWVQIY